jgi:hypothetical protein
VTLKELNEGSQKAVSYTPKNSFSFIMKNLFRRKKMPGKQKLVADEYHNDEEVLLNSLRELFATEAVKD